MLCNFQSADEEIMRMMLSRCPDTKFQEKRMLAGWDHTKLAEAEAFARNIEQSHLLQKRIKSSYGNHSRVNKITAHMQCRNCGRSHGQNCPAKNQKCHFCKKIGHFKAQCLKLKSLGYSRGRGQARGSRSRGGRGGRGNRGRGNFGNSFRGNARGQSHGRRGRGGYRVGSVRQIREKNPTEQVSSSSISNSKTNNTGQGHEQVSHSFLQSLINLRIQ